MTGSVRRVAITGAAGYVAGRLIERLERVDISVARAAPCPRQQSTGDPERQPAPRLLLQPPPVSWPSPPMFWHCWRVLAGNTDPLCVGECLRWPNGI